MQLTVDLVREQNCLLVQLSATITETAKMSGFLNNYRHQFRRKNALTIADVRPREQTEPQQELQPLQRKAEGQEMIGIKVERSVTSAFLEQVRVRITATAPLLTSGSWTCNCSLNCAELDTFGGFFFTFAPTEVR